MARPGLLAFLVLTLTLTLASSAHASSGALAPEDATLSVDTHRTVVALGPDATTIWDQIGFSGEARDFVWILPVPDPEATVSVASREFMDSLEEFSAPTIIRAQHERCPGQGGCGSFGFSASDGQERITIHHQGTVGPFETTTISSDADPTAIYLWLTDHGYLVPDSAIPIFSRYIEQHQVFIVLRLAPGQGVDAIQPVRVRYNGGFAALPVPMSTLGVKGAVDLTLWVIADQRMETASYPTVAVDPAKLVWDWDTNHSNYVELFDGAIANAGGRGWVVELTQAVAPFTSSSSAEADIEAAFGGKPTRFVTRLRTRMAVDKLTDDLTLRASEDPAEVHNEALVVSKYANAPACAQNSEPLYDGPDCGCRVHDRRARATFAPLALGALVLLGLRRRRRRD